MTFKQQNLTDKTSVKSIHTDVWERIGWLVQTLNGKLVFINNLFWEAILL